MDALLRVAAGIVVDDWVGIKRGYGCGWRIRMRMRKYGLEKGMEDKTRMRKGGWRIKRG